MTGSAQMAPSLSQMSGASASSSVAQAGLTATSGVPTNAQPNGLGLVGGGGGGIGGSGSTLGVSPGPGQLNFASPAYGLDIGTPGMLDPGSMGGLGGLNGLNALGGINGMGGSVMNMSLSEMGLGRSGRSTDEERRHRLSLVLGKLLDRRHAEHDHSSGMGRISDEGIRRVGAWAGFDVEVEAKYNKPGFEGSRPIVIAGRNAILIDINLKEHIAQKVQVSFSSEHEAVTSHEKAAADVLRRDLTSGTAMVNSKLDRFAANLETLARLDKLSSVQFNAVEALTGVYTSLHRLYEHEKKTAELLFGDSRERIETHVMCRGSGVPSMHSSRRVGLSLDYLLDKSALENEDSEKHSGNDNESNDDTMQVDKPAPTLRYKKLSLELTLEPPTDQIYIPARNSSDWITFDSRDTSMPDPSLQIDQTQRQIPEGYTWLEPAQTIANDEPNPTIGHGPDGLSAATNLDIPDSQNRLPNAFFVAKLHPPINLPPAVAAEIFQVVRSGPPLNLLPTSWLSTCVSLTDNADMQVRADLVGRTRKTVTAADGDCVTHDYALYDVKPETCVNISQLPFEHPRQIVQVLPVLRQWGFVAALLNSVTAQTTAAPGEVDLDELLNENTLPRCSGGLQVDLSVSAQPTPVFTVAFPAVLKRQLVRVSFQVLANARVVILDQNLEFEVGTDKPDATMGGEVSNNEQQAEGLSKTQAHAERLATALEICGDLGTWIEWLRQKYLRQSR